MTETRDDVPLDVLRTLGWATATIEILHNAFADMEQADRACRETGAECFKALQRPEALRNAPSWLYEAHIRELCARDVAGEDLRPGTWAEILMAMSRTSLDAPLNERGRFLAWRAFSECAAERAAVCWPSGDEPRAPWEGFEAEEVGALRRRLSVAGRTR